MPTTEMVRRLIHPRKQVDRSGSSWQGGPIPTFELCPLITTRHRSEPRSLRLDNDGHGPGAVDCSRPGRVEPSVKRERLHGYRQPIRFLARVRAIVLEINVYRSIGTRFQVASISECVAVSRIGDGEPLQIVNRHRPELVNGW